MAFFGKFSSQRSAVIFDDAVGIDISDRSVQFAALTHKKGVFSVVATGEVELEPEVVVRGRIKDEQKLQIAVRKVFNEAKPKKVNPRHIVVGLPENQTYVHAFVIKKSEAGKLDELVKREVQSYIPLPYEEVVWSSKVLYENKENIEVLIVAASREVVEEWQTFFDSIEMHVELFDIEQLAVYRSIFSEPLTTPICVIDLGALNSHIALFDLHGLRYSYTAKVSGEHMTKNIATKLAKSFEEAEALKKQTGLSGSDEAVTNAIKEVLFPVFDDIMKTIAYFEKRMGTKVEELVLVGGSSQIVDLAKVVAERTKLKTRLGTQTMVQLELPSGCAESMGLAYRIMDKKWEKRDPAFFPLDRKVKEEREKKSREIAPIVAVAKSPELLGTEEVGTRGSSGIPEDEEGGGDTKKQLYILGAILLIGALLVPGAFWYKSKEDASRAAEQKARLERLDAIDDSKTKVAATSTPQSDVAATTTATTTVMTDEVASTTATTTEEIMDAVSDAPATEEVTETIPDAQAAVEADAVPDEEVVLVSDVPDTGGDIATSSEAE